MELLESTSACKITIIIDSSHSIFYCARNLDGVLDLKLVHSRIMVILFKFSCINFFLFGSIILDLLKQFVCFFNILLMLFFDISFCFGSKFFELFLRQLLLRDWRSISSLCRCSLRFICFFFLNDFHFFCDHLYSLNDLWLLLDLLFCILLLFLLRFWLSSNGIRNTLRNVLILLVIIEKIRLVH